MKKTFCKTFLIVIILFFTGCASVTERESSAGKPHVTDRLDATYEKDVLPYIIEQINRTAAAFYYDMDKFSRIMREHGLSVRYSESLIANVIVGNNEIGGVCQDYAWHFIDNYRGLGDVYYVGVDPGGETNLIRRIKPFEKSDIIFNDTMTAASYAENIYNRIISSAAREEGANYRWQDDNNQWTTFYTRTRNGTIYWTEDQSNQTPTTPFTKERIRINQGNFEAERNKIKEEYINTFYNQILQAQKERLSQGWVCWEQSLSSESAGWYISPAAFNSTKDGNLYLIEQIPIPTPASHAGETDPGEFYNHAWVRIIWRDMTIDIDPTWYDNGRPIDFGSVERIIPGSINTYPRITGDYRQLSNTKLISPITGKLKTGNNYTFIISSTDYSDFSIIINNNWNNFTKNNETGNFELNLTIPEGVDIIRISGVTVSINRRTGTGLIGYTVEK